MKRLIALSMVFCMGACTCAFAKGLSSEDGGKPMRIILDTDIGNDVDDALALDMLYKYMDSKQIKLLGILTNKDTKYAPEFVDIMNRWYGYPSIPIGTITDGVGIDDYVDYAANVCKLEDEDGNPMFVRSRKGYGKLLPSHLLYRKILAKQPDNSVTVISIGFSTNLARLLETPGDKYSPLSGKELVARKVRLLSVMGGDFVENPRREFNIVNDIPAAQKLFDLWPGKIVVSPFDVGKQVLYPASSIENDFDWGMHHPMVEAYLHYRPMPYNRPTWDLTSVLYAIEPECGFFSESPKGRISVTDEGYTVFEAMENGSHTYLSLKKGQGKMMLERFMSLLREKPKNLKKAK